MSTKQQPDALLLADEAWNFDCSEYRGVRSANAAMMGKLQDCADMIRKLHAENESLRAERERNLDSIRVSNEIINKKNAELETLRTGYAAARLEIESLRARLHAAKQINAAQFTLLAASIPGAALRPPHGQAPAQAAPAAVAVPTFEDFCKRHGLDPKKMDGHGGMWARVALDECRATAQPVPQQEAQEPVAWRELCRRLYVELYYCNQQMTSGKRPKWQQGKTVRDVLADAKAALDASPQPLPASQGDALDAEQHEMDARHAAIYRWMLSHVADVLSIFDNWFADEEADTDELHDALAARAAQEGKKP